MMISSLEALRVHWPSPIMRVQHSVTARQCLFKSARVTPAARLMARPGRLQQNEPARNPGPGRGRASRREGCWEQVLGPGEAWAACQPASTMCCRCRRCPRRERSRRRRRLARGRRRREVHWPWLGRAGAAPHCWYRMMASSEPAARGPHVKGQQRTGSHTANAPRALHAAMLASPARNAH